MSQTPQGDRVARSVMLPAIAAGLAIAAPQATAASSLRFDLRLTTRTPAAATGIASRVIYPDDGTGKPKAIERLAVALPDGARFDESVVPVCEASDDELYAAGTSACPPPSKVGRGRGSVVTGFGPPVDPVHGDLHIFHGPRELIFAGTPKDSDRVATIARFKIRGSALVNEHVPSTPGWPPPDGETVAKEVSLTIAKRSSKGRAFLTAPSQCPASGVWTSRITATYRDGSVERVPSTSACTRPARQLAVSVRPNRAQPGRRTVFHFRATDRSTGRGVRGVRVRFAKKLAWTDGSGRTEIVQRFTKPGRYRPRATKPGWREARTRVSVG